MNWISEHRFIVVIGVIATLFVAFILTQPKSDKALADYQKIDMTSSMVRGSDDAAVSLIQYSDFLCPSCSYFSTQVMPTIDSEYIDGGQVKFEFRPMAFIAEGSTIAGEGAYCAVDQDKFWDYHDKIYEYVYEKVYSDGMDPKTDVILTTTRVKNIAEDAGLDRTSFDSCLDEEKYLDKITESNDQANRDGVLSTPFIMVNGEALQGSPSLETVEALIKVSL